MSNMSKPYKYFLALLSFFVAFLILFSSFNSVSRSTLAKENSFKARRFYVQKEILPDHSLYPLLMLVDRFRLAMADQERRVYLLTAYANRRLFYAVKLLDKAENNLSLTTFTKAEKYLNQALVEVKLLKAKDQHNQSYDELVFFVLESSEQHLLTLEKKLDCFTVEHRSVLINLQNETLLLKSELSQ